MEKVIYVCDDGYATEEGEGKRNLVASLNTLCALADLFAGLFCACAAAPSAAAGMHPPAAARSHARWSFVTCRSVAAALCALPAGHHNVVYVGDHVKRGQLNGKSANLNHAIFNQIYPELRCPADVPVKDVLMVMDCDHMVKPSIFLKMGACMLHTRVGVTLVPQVRAVCPRPA
jgi:cellulose synthase/poly-beta-1,6-N-acetylglucosamine synthase-like glycosyltransferase